MEYWRPAGYNVEHFGENTVLSNIPYLNEQTRLSRVIENMMGSVYSLQLCSDVSLLDTYIDQVNQETCDWMENLPDFAKLDMSARIETAPIPGNATLQ